MKKAILILMCLLVSGVSGDSNTAENFGIQDWDTIYEEMFLDSKSTFDFLGFSVYTQDPYYKIFEKGQTIPIELYTDNSNDPYAHFVFVIPRDLADKDRFISAIEAVDNWNWGSARSEGHNGLLALRTMSERHNMEFSSTLGMRKYPYYPGTGQNTQFTITTGSLDLLSKTNRKYIAVLVQVQRTCTVHELDICTYKFRVGFQGALVVENNFCSEIYSDWNGDSCLRKFKGYCNEIENKCVDPCANCRNSAYKICLADFALDSNQLKQLTSISSDLCFEKTRACDDTSDCKNWVSQYYSDYNDLVKSKTSLDRFKNGVHCEFRNPSNPVIDKINSFGRGNLGTCESGAQSYNDCDSIFGDATQWKPQVGDGQFRDGKGYMVKNGVCYIYECGDRGDCITPLNPDVSDWQCLRVAGDSWELDGGMCKHNPGIASACSSNSDCAGKVDCAQGSPACLSSVRGGVNYCGCQDEAPPVSTCGLAGNPDKCCMQSEVLSSCTAWKWVGDAITGDCQSQDARCSTDSDCLISGVQGQCEEGCCVWDSSPPSSPDIIQPIGDQPDNTLWYVVGFLSVIVLGMGWKTGLFKALIK